MSEKDTGGPAFPAQEKVEYPSATVIEYHLGATLRDYFAAKAMQAMITKSDGQSKTGGAKGVPLIADFAYEFADAMLNARKS